MARPSEYNEEKILALTREYIDLCEDQEEEFHKTRGAKSDSFDRLVRVKIPTIEGLSLHLKITRETVYDWESKYPAFSYILSILKAKQAARLLDKGLSGDYNPIIAKMMLTKHGYTDKTETDITSKGEKLSQVIGITIHKPDDTKDS